MGQEKSMRDGGEDPILRPRPAPLPSLRTQLTAQPHSLISSSGSSLQTTQSKMNQNPPKSASNTKRIHKNQFGLNLQKNQLHNPNFPSQKSTNVKIIRKEKDLTAYVRKEKHLIATFFFFF